jgi:hypothetical protein
MPHLSISSEDARILRELLEGALVDLSREISHTDTREFRRVLIERERALERLLRETREHERDDPVTRPEHKPESRVV